MEDFSRLLLLLLSFSSAIVTGEKGLERARERRETGREYWARVLGGEGLDLRLAPHVNSWPELFHQIQDETANRSHLIEADVFLHWGEGGRAEPTMLIPPNRAHSLTLRQWITRAPAADRAVKLNLLSTQAVRPSLQYIFAHKHRLYNPLIIHADVLAGPGSASSAEAVSPSVLIREAADLAPNATLGLGWTKTERRRAANPARLAYSWRDVLDMLAVVYDCHQPVLFTVKAGLASASFHQLLFLLGVRREWGLLIRDSPAVADWAGLIGLREQLAPERVLYDLSPDKVRHLREARPGGAYRSVYVPPSPWDRSAWRVVQFINPSRILSTIILSDRGAAFLGWPTAFLLSEKRPGPASVPHRLSGRLLFVPKPEMGGINRERRTGLSIFLLNSLLDIGSPRLEASAAVALFIGLDGTVRIRGSRPPPSPLRRRRRRGRHRIVDIVSRPLRRDFAPQAESAMPPSPCYAFEMVDSGKEVSLDVAVERCSGSSARPPPKSWRRLLRLPIRPPPSGRQRHVVVQKTGDGTLDVVLERLAHSGAVGYRLAGLLSGLISLALLLLPRLL